jgi:hypothetical protein
MFSRRAAVGQSCSVRTSPSPRWFPMFQALGGSILATWNPVSRAEGGQVAPR